MMKRIEGIYFCDEMSIHNTDSFMISVYYEYEDGYGHNLSRIAKEFNAHINNDERYNFWTSGFLVFTDQEQFIKFKIQYLL